ncbi:hypothetical protein QR680_004715 [Steinernema hermaphroditum]|uniref:Uncharacterized protein n=1 Tax=Steinernema hermaphroditum TaxID=289476 RepID=A0AA39HQS2_9BILA|nr:hypothetical protein QR680_004715 [Steinernema hermaphroditum]
MVSRASTSKDDVEGVVYKYVKRRNPALLKEMFPRERRNRLEKNDVVLSDLSLTEMLENYKAQSVATEKKKCIDGLIYNFVKRRKPAILKEMFTNEQCNLLETKNYPFANVRFSEMLQNHNSIHPPRNSASTDWFQLLDESDKADLVVYKHLLDRKQGLQMTHMFNAERRARLGELKQKPGCPSLGQLLDHYNKVKERKKKPKRVTWKLDSIQ